MSLESLNGTEYLGAHIKVYMTQYHLSLECRDSGKKMMEFIIKL